MTYRTEVEFVKKYLSFFRLRFCMGLQYRAAALAGIATQFVWGFLEIMVYRAFYEADANVSQRLSQAIPMTDFARWMRAF